MCPICNYYGLRIYSGGGETKIRCLNSCHRTEILAQVGLTSGDLRPESLGLTNGLSPTQQTADASGTQAERRSAQSVSTPPILAQDVRAEGGE